MFAHAFAHVFGQVYMVYECYTHNANGKNRMLYVSFEKKINKNYMYNGIKMKKKRDVK